jgi:hypothetical protein
MSTGDEVLSGHAVAQGYRPIGPWRSVLDYPLIYRWDRQGHKGQRCRVITRGAKNSVLVEFATGVRMLTSGNALRRG